MPILKFLPLWIGSNSIPFLWLIAGGLREFRVESIPYSRRRRCPKLDQTKFKSQLSFALVVALVKMSPFGCWLPLAQLLFVAHHQTPIHRQHRKSCAIQLSTSTPTKTTENNIDIDPVALEIVPLESVLNFRRALPGTNLPIYRCAAFDNASANDVVSLQSISTIVDLRNTDEIVKGSTHSRTITSSPQ